MKEFQGDGGGLVQGLKLNVEQTQGLLGKQHHH